MKERLSRSTTISLSLGLIVVGMAMFLARTVMAMIEADVTPAWISERAAYGLFGAVGGFSIIFAAVLTVYTILQSLFRIEEDNRETIRSVSTNTDAIRAILERDQGQFKPPSPLV